MDIVKRKRCRGLCKNRACFDYKSWRSTQYKHRFLTLPPPLQNYWLFPCSVPFLGRWLLRQWEPCWTGCAAQLRVETQRAHFARDWLTRCKAFRLTMGSSSGRSRVLDASRKCASRTVWSGDCCQRNQWSYGEKKGQQWMLNWCCSNSWTLVLCAWFTPVLSIFGAFCPFLVGRNDFIHTLYWMAARVLFFQPLEEKFDSRYCIKDLKPLVFFFSSISLYHSNKCTKPWLALQCSCGLRPAHDVLDLLNWNPRHVTSRGGESEDMIKTTGKDNIFSCEIL